MDKEKGDAMNIEARKKFIINFAYFALLVGIIYLVLKHVLVLLTPFIIGFLVAFLLQKVINYLSSKLPVSKKIIALVTVIIFYLAVIAVLFGLGVSIFAGIQNLIEKLPQIYATDIEPLLFRLFKWAENILARFSLTPIQLIEEMHVNLSQSLGKIVSDMSATAISAITSLVSFVPMFFIGIILAVISSVFFAIDYTLVVDSIKKMIPQGRRGTVSKLKKFVGQLGVKYIKAYLILMLITFIELSIGLSILRIEGAIGIAALIALIDILPVLGTGGVMIPWSIIELVKGEFALGIGLAVLYLIVTVIRNILEPKMVGKQIGLHPLIMLIAMYVGVRVLGIIGLFIFPMAGIGLKYLYDNGKLSFD